MAKNQNSKTYAVMTRVSPEAGAALEERCAAEGITPAEFARRVLVQELGVEATPEADAAKNLLRLYVAIKQAEIDGPLSHESFEELVDQYVPWLFEEETQNA